MVAGIGLILLSSVYPNCDRTPEATQGPRRHIRAASLRSNRGDGEFPVRKDTHTHTHTHTPRDLGSTRGKWRTHRVSFLVVRHKSGVVNFDDGVTGTIDVGQLRSGGIRLGNVGHITFKNPCEIIFLLLNFQLPFLSL